MVTLVGEVATNAEPDGVIRLRAVSCPGRDGSPALHGVTLDVQRGETYALLGGHGAGKTTALDLVVGLLRPDRGQVRVVGRDPCADPTTVRHQLSYIGGSSGLHDTLSPVDNVRFFLSLVGQANRASRITVTGVLRQVEIPDRYLDVPVRTLPRWVAVSTQLALAILRQTTVVVLDDPTLGLDSRAASGLHRSLGIVRQGGTTILIATSDVVLAGGVADRTGVLVHGQLTIEHERARWLDRSVVELYNEYLGDAGPFGSESPWLKHGAAT